MAKKKSAQKEKEEKKLKAKTPAKAAKTAENLESMVKGKLGHGKQHNVRLGEYLHKTQSAIEESIAKENMKDLEFEMKMS